MWIASRQTRIAMLMLCVMLGLALLAPPVIEVVERCSVPQPRNEIERAMEFWSRPGPTCDQLKDRLPHRLLPERGGAALLLIGLGFVAFSWLRRGLEIEPVDTMRGPVTRPSGATTQPLSRPLGMQSDKVVEGTALLPTAGAPAPTQPAETKSFFAREADDRYGEALAASDKEAQIVKRGEVDHFGAKADDRYGEKQAKEPAAVLVSTPGGRKGKGFFDAEGSRPSGSSGAASQGPAGPRGPSGTRPPGGFFHKPR